ncbi:MAG: hypothetical protein ACPHK8_01195 [Thermoplasmatota archaeon]
MPRLNPAQHRLLERHYGRAVEALEEAQRLLKGLVDKEVEDSISFLNRTLDGVDREEARMVEFDLDGMPNNLISYLESPFAQGLAFNLFCLHEGLSHTRAAKKWDGGNAAVSARNLPFLPPIFHDLWEEGHIDKTRLLAISNRNLTDRGYDEIATIIRTHRKEDLDDFLLRVPSEYLKMGRRGPEQAIDAAEQHGWLDKFETVEIAADLVDEADEAEINHEEGNEPWQQALRTLRAGLSGAEVDEAVIDGLQKSPDPMILVERFLTAHRQSGEPDPSAVSKTLFFAHAGPIQKLVADDKFLLRHFRPVKTQKRGQLFYRLLEVIEEILLEKQHLTDLEARGVQEAEACEAVRRVVDELNKDPNRWLEIPDQWLGEVTRRHLYFGSRTRKEGSAYKWFRKMGVSYFLGGHKTQEELDEKEERKAAKANL